MKPQLLITMHKAILLPLGLSLMLAHASLRAADADPANPTPPPAPAGDTNAPDANIRFQFEDMPYADVLTRFAQMAERPLLVETNLEGTLTFSDPNPYTYPEALDALNLILAMKQVMLVESGRYLRLVPLDKLAQTEIPIYRGLDQTGDVRPREVITTVLELKNLDAGEVAAAVSPMLSNAGSVAPLSRGRGLVVTDRKENIQRVQKLLDELDSDTQVERQMKTYKLLHASGATVADLINRTFGIDTAPKRLQLNPKTNTYQELSPDPNSYVTAIFDEASRTLVLFGPRDRIELAENLLSEFEDKAGGRAGDVRIFEPRALQASELASMIRQAVPGVAGQDETGPAAATKARVIVDAALNRLIVSAPVAGQMETIEKLIQKVDGEAGAPAEAGGEQITRLLQPARIDLATAAQIITNALSRRLPNGTVISRLQASLDPTTRSLVLTGSAADVEQAASLLAQLEASTPDDAAQQTWFIHVNSRAEAERLAPLLTRIYQDQIASRPIQPRTPAKVSTDEARLIVTATQADYAAIQDILKDLQAPAAADTARQLTILTLKNARIDRIVANLTNLVADRLSGPAFATGTPPFLLPDPTNNRLLVTATADQLREIEAILATLDVAPPEGQRDLAMIPLQLKSPDEVLPLLNQLLEQGGPDARPDHLKPRIMPDPQARQLVVLAQAADIEKIRALVARIEKGGPAPADRSLQAVQLYRRKADALTPLVEQLYREQLNGQPEPLGGRATLVAESQDNRIMVSGTQAEIARVESIVRQLDPAAAEGARDEVRIIRLKMANAAELVDLVDKSLNAQRKNVQVLVETRSNSLIVSGETEAVASAATMIEQLDTRPDRDPRELRIIELREAEAATIAPLVTELFTQLIHDQHGPNYTSTTRITADSSANRLIVSGQRHEVEQAALLVQQLDKAPEHSGGARVFQLKAARAATLLPIVTSAMTRFNAAGQPIQQTMVSADEKSNSLIITGTRNDLQDAAMIIETLDTEAHGRQRAFRILSVKAEDPASLASLATRILSDQRPTPNLEDAITITPQPFGRRLIVLAPESRMTEIEALVSALDGTPDAANRSLHMVDLKQGQATTVLPVVQEIYADQSRGDAGRPATLYAGNSGRRLAVLGTPEQADTIRSIVASLESKPDAATNRQTKVVHVGTQTDAQRLLPILQQLYQDRVKDLDPAATSDAQILSDGKTGRLIISGRADHVTLITNLIEQATIGTGQPEERLTRIFNVGNPSEVSRLQPLVEQLYNDQWKDRGGEDPPDARILADAPAGRLIVTGRAEHLKAIESILAELSANQARVEPLDTRIYDLKTATVSELVTTLTTLYQEQLRNRTDKPAIDTLILPDTGVNRLILAGTAEELDRLEPLIRKLDATSEQTAGTRVIKLKNARSESIAPVISSALVRYGRSGQPINRVSVGSDRESNILIISGDALDLQAAAVIVEQLDVAPTVTPRQLHIIPLETGLASDLATRVTTLYQEQVKDHPVSRGPSALIMGDDTSNRLLITATEEDLARIQAIVARLDEAPPESGRQIRIVTLEHNSASAVASILSQLFSREISTSDPSRRLILSPAPDERTLVIDASGPMFRQIEGLVAQLESPGTEPGSLVKTVHLKTAEASDVAQAVNDTLRARGSVTASKQIRITPVSSANSLLIQAPTNSLQEILDIIHDIDAESVSTDISVRVFQLEHADAGEVENIIQPLLQGMYYSQLRRGGGGGARRPIPLASVNEDRNGNRLVVTGVEAHFRLIEEVLPELDKAPETPLRDIQVVYLENARASEIATQLEDLFGDRPQRERPSIQWDLTGNSLTLIARPGDLAEMQGLIRRLDTAALDQSIQIRLLPVDFVPARQMADMLGNLYPQMHRGTIRFVDRITPPAEEPAPGTNPPTPAPEADNPPAPDDAGTTNAPAPDAVAAPAGVTNTFPEVVIAVDEDSNSLIISGPATELNRIESMLYDLSFSFISTDAEFRQFTLSEADPVSVAKTLNDLFKQQEITTTTKEGQQTKQAARPPKLTTVADTRTRSVIVRADPTEFTVLESLIKQLDAPGLKPELEYRVVTLTNAAPDKVLPLVTELGRQLSTIRPGEPVSITADTRSRSLIIVARDKALEQMEALVRELDNPAVHGETEVLMLPLQKANAAQVATILQNLIRPDTAALLTPEARELQDQVRKLRIRNAEGNDIQLDLNKPMKIMADPAAAGATGGNRLIFASTPDNLQALVALAKRLDELAITEGVQIRVLPLQHADATTAAQTLTTIFTQGRTLGAGPAGPSQPDSDEGRALVNPLTIAADPRSNTLVISGRKDSLELAERIVTDLDRELDHFVTEVRLFTLKHASAIRLAPMLQAVFAESGPPVPGSEGLNTLVTRLQTADSTNTTVQPKIRAAVTIQPDVAANTLIVAARKDLIPLIDDVIQKLDIPAASGMDSIRIIPLQHADAARVQAVIEDLFSASKVPQLRPEERPNVTIDPRSNSLIITGNSKAFAIIEGLVAQLDAEEVTSRARFQVFALTNATAVKLQGTLQQLLANRPPSIRGQAVDPITIVSDTVANALIVGAAPEDMGMVEGLIERLDTAPGEAAGEYDIIPLSKADAAGVAQTIQNLYRGSTPAGAAPVVVNVDERLNAVIVSAGEVDRKRIAELVRKLDTESVGRVSEIRVIQLKYARATTLSTILNSSLNTNPEPLPGQSANVQPLLQFITRAENGEDLITSALKERVLITPDARMNSLIVSGPLDYMPLLEQIIKRLDDASPQLAKIKVFTLLNADARQLADVLTSLFRLQPAGGVSPAGQRTVQYTLVLPGRPADPANPDVIATEPVEGASATIGTAEENALTVTVDPRTNSLLVGGADNYLTLASEIIESLDASPVQERETEVYRLRNAQAPEVETALRTFLDQDRQRIIQALGPDAVGAAERLLEREVAIVAEPISNALLMSANPRYFEEIKSLIEQLDQPQPQVLIQSLIAEVVIDATTDLGVEWAYTGSSGSKTYDIGTDFGVANALQSFGGFSAAITGSDYTFLVRALQNDGRLEILSRPQILTADNQPATINVGQKVPLITNSRVTDQGNVINSFEYQNVGVILTVTPRISPDGFVRMDVGTTNSALSSSGVDVGDGLQAPIINERLATTTVSVRSGQSIIIGGLISTTEDERLKKVPVLGDIPLIRYLFRSSEKFKDRKELLIFLTPQVLVKLDGEGTTTDAATLTREMLKQSKVKDELKEEMLKEQILDPGTLEDLNQETPKGKKL